MHLQIENSFTSVARFALLMLCIGAVSAGCNQQRYKPAKWRPAARKTTLPESQQNKVSGNLRWTSLPTSQLGTLPFRSGSGSTLPNRGGWSGTLPMRWSTLPNRGMSTLPNRGMSTLPQRFVPQWSTLPNRGRMTTLPNRPVYPEYRLPRRNWSTLPTRNWSTLPSTR